jgi:glycine oxidase
MIRRAGIRLVGTADFVRYNGSMQRSTDVLVIGGGVIGLTTAYELARAGRHVIVVDRGQMGREASWAGAGIIPPGNPKRALGPYERLRAMSAILFEELATKLALESGIDTGYRVCGGIEFPESEDDKPPVEAWTWEGIEWTLCNALTLKQFEPGLVPPVTPAYLLPELAQVRNPRHLKALIAAAMRLGVTLCPECSVYGYSIAGRKLVAADTRQGSIEANQFVICAGAWSRRVVGALCFALPMFPVRGQILLLRLPAPIFSHVLIQGKRYLVPRDDGRVLVGSTEDYVCFDRNTVESDLEELHAFAVKLVPALAGAEIESSWAGLRPGAPDGLPFIGPMPELDNVWVAAGHFRAGIHLSPATARVICQMVCGETTAVPMDAFRLDRALDAPIRPAFRS